MSGTPFPDRFYAFRGAMMFIRTSLNGHQLTDYENDPTDAAILQHLKTGFKAHGVLRQVENTDKEFRKFMKIARPAQHSGNPYYRKDPFRYSQFSRYNIRAANDEEDEEVEEELSLEEFVLKETDLNVSSIYLSPFGRQLQR